MFAMKIWKKYVEYLFVCIVVCFSCFSIVSWQESVCQNIEWGYTCIGVSENFQQPFCVTNFNSNHVDGDVDNAVDCIWLAIGNGGLNGNSDVKTRDLIESYCHSLFWGSNGWRIYFAKYSDALGGFDRQQTFDSHQSLFLYALCSSFKDETWKMPFVPWNA